MQVRCPMCGPVTVDTSRSNMAGIINGQFAAVVFTCYCGEQRQHRVPPSPAGQQVMHVLSALGRPVVAMPTRRTPDGDLPALDLDDLIDLGRDMEAVIEHLLEDQ